MKLPYLSSLFITISIAAAMSGCTSPEVRKERIESDIKQKWNPEQVGDLTREQAFKDCNDKAKAFNVQAEGELSNWDAFMRTCMRDKGFSRTVPKP